MSKKNQTPNAQAAEPLPPAPGSETDTQRLIAAWKEGTARWQREYESFPAAYFKLACVVDEIERRGKSPNDPSSATGAGRKDTNAK